MSWNNGISGDELCLTEKEPPWVSPLGLINSESRGRGAHTHHTFRRQPGQRPPSHLPGPSGCACSAPHHTPARRTSHHSLWGGNSPRSHPPSSPPPRHTRARRSGPAPCHQACLVGLHIRAPFCNCDTTQIQHPTQSHPTLFFKTSKDRSHVLGLVTRLVTWASSPVPR